MPREKHKRSMIITPNKNIAKKKKKRKKGIK